MVFLDTNILLEVILKGRSHFDAAEKYLKTVTDETAISVLTVHLVMYFGRKASIADEVLEDLVNENELLSITPEDYVWAVLNEQDRDFEDALQLASAIRHRCTSFITFDNRLIKSYTNLPLKIVTP